ncbi:hypothetical protein PINS_up001435 [Pythium insidiosum]|nr:hypothetical protein PINS_up001435 [Pythium insidiosum]
MEDLLIGLRVSFTYCAADRRQSSAKYNRDLKVLSIQPLTPSLLSQPLVRIALAFLCDHHNQQQQQQPKLTE